MMIWTISSIKTLEKNKIYFKKILLKYFGPQLATLTALLKRMFQIWSKKNSSPDNYKHRSPAYIFLWKQNSCQSLWHSSLKKVWKSQANFTSQYFFHFFTQSSRVSRKEIKYKNNNDKNKDLYFRLGISPRWPHKFFLTLLPITRKTNDYSRTRHHQENPGTWVWG